MRILLVEDSPWVAQLVARTLRQRGHEVARWSGDLDGFLPELLLLDLHVGPEDGWSILARVRARVPGVRVVLTSGADDSGMQRESRRQGVNEWLPKPFTTEALISTVEA